ncbi:VOC family protein [Amycolatopsis sp. FDAARGOS 1241]|uniref:VOC family protein n=1 Tax=Amycolatopsis sp. FDAARGOS 1241 TaxID=2778070 RepID=UPI001951C200|nr:VOC family protein [Amycolatopsis sp. FDAARGOS 1241]QRP49930.1 VOC family protein [Amycolatopsis sp. FDAARGOS 1241]
MTVSRIQFVTVPVADQAAARDFYVGKLGLDVVVDRAGPAGRFVMVAPKGAQTGLVLVDYPISGVHLAGPLHFQLDTSDLDADITALRANGVDVPEPQTMPWGRATSIKDLDGNGVGLLEPSAFGNRPN